MDSCALRTEEAIIKKENSILEKEKDIVCLLKLP
jgi:hypothetical protein